LTGVQSSPRLAHRLASESLFTEAVSHAAAARVCRCPMDRNFGCHVCKLLRVKKALAMRAPRNEERKEDKVCPSSSASSINRFGKRERSRQREQQVKTRASDAITAAAKPAAALPVSSIVACGGGGGQGMKPAPTGSRSVGRGAAGRGCDGDGDGGRGGGGIRGVGGGAGGGR